MAGKKARVPGRINLLDLPNELLIEISTHIYSQPCLSRLSRVNRRFHELLKNDLFRRNICDDGSSGVSWAFKKKDIKLLSRLQQHGADLYYPNGLPPHLGPLPRYHMFRSEPLLHRAARNGSMLMVKALIDLGVDPLRGNSDNYLPLVPAVLNGKDEVAKYLISFLPSVDFPISARNRTALQVACLSRRGTILRHLLKSGADPNDKSNSDELSAFTELLGDWGVEFDQGSTKKNKKMRDSAFDMLSMFIKRGAEPDALAMAKGLASPDERVQLLFEKIHARRCASGAEMEIVQKEEDKSFDEE